MKGNDWQRPRTTKVYLHRPLSERIALLCPDFKILSLSLLDDGTHVGQPGVGVLFLHGEEPVAFDIDKTEFRTVRCGCPIYEIENRGECITRIEAFADGERNPTIYFKVSLINDSSVAVKGNIAVMPRSGQEKYMVNQHQEGYSPYRPNHKNWYMLKRTWFKEEELLAKSDMGQLRISYEDLDVTWVRDSKSRHSFAASDYFDVRYSLEAGESKCFFGAIRAEEDVPIINYEKMRRDAEEFWSGMVDKITCLPDTVDEKYLGAYIHCAIQCTQMLARYEGSRGVSVRQGDIARFVWPYEGVQVLTNLERAGICEYSFDAYCGYLDRWFVKDGDDRGKIGSNAGWDNFTGSVLFGICEHLKKCDSESEFEHFIPYLVDMREWIEKKRMTPREDGFERIFPAGTGSDWSERGQFWTFTDSHNCMALRSMCEMLLQYGSEEYERTKAIYDDYSEIIEDIRDLHFRGHEQDEYYILPHMLGIPFEDSENYSYYTDGAPYLLYTGFIEPGSEIHKKMEEFFRVRGQFERGLTGRMTSCSSMWDEAYFGGYGDVWYTMQSETCWIRSWVKCGEMEKAKETLDACLYYGMTKENVVAERYCSINPWYNPWQPNGSGSSRVIEMMLDYFGRK